MLIVVAPHPDDEWIGCGCTILKAINSGQKVKVLLVTRVERSERRVKVSKELAKNYNYEIKILGEDERNIDVAKLKKFVLSETSSKDVIYIPDKDNHIDHRTVNEVVKSLPKFKAIYEYAIYNNSKNGLIRLFNKFKGIVKSTSYPSFCYGNGKLLNFQRKIKSENILKFGEKPRDADLIRKVN